jgi:hypothetical protein
MTTVRAPTDDELLTQAMAAANGDKFRRLWLGEWDDLGEYPSQSEADAAFLEMLAFWTNGDAARMEAIFGRSLLCREKWTERPDYRERTIAYAIDCWRASEHRNGHEPPPDTDDDPPTDEPPAPPTEPRTLTDVVSTFRRWLYLEDAGALYVFLGCLAANYLPGDPVWLMLVGGSSVGKTEPLQAAAGLSSVHVMATLTGEGALLSGTSKREQSRGATGGLLRQVGDFGILLLKDFGSIISMHRDARANVLAALREVFDGSWTRYVGADGGRQLHWQGKLGLVAACTTAIDTAYAVSGTLGERFVMYRLALTERNDQAERALDNARLKAQMRRELADAVQGLFADLDRTAEPPDLSPDERRRFVSLANLATLCRSGVVRDGYRREIELIMDEEGPARLAGALLHLYWGMLAIGVDRADAWPVIVKCAFDSMPKVRRDVFDALRDGGWHATNAIALQVSYPTVTARRALEDLAAHRVTRRRQAEGKADEWALTNRARELLATVSETSGEGVAEGEPPSVSETSGDGVDGGGVPSPSIYTNTVSDDFSETVSGYGSTRETSCWKCKEPLSSDGDVTCSLCGWLRCVCGACKEGCDGGHQTCCNCGAEVPLLRGVCLGCGQPMTDGDA